MWVNAPAGSNEKTTDSAPCFVVLLQPWVWHSTFKLTSQVHVDVVVHSGKACPSLVIASAGAWAAWNRAVNPAAWRGCEW